MCEREPEQLESFEGAYYKLLANNPMILKLPVNSCEDLHGYVVEIGTQEGQNFVKNFLSTGTAQVLKSAFSGYLDVWLGARDEDTKGDFYWENKGTTVGEFSG